MFTREEAEEILALARSKKDSWSTLGECIYLNLPEHIEDIVLGTDKDMYWVKNDDEAVEMLMALVDEG